ncbi:MAG: transposase [Sphaerochaeta sp.]
MPNMLMDFTNNTENITSQGQDFSHRFKIGGILKTCGAYKQKGIAVMSVFYCLGSLLFCNVSMNRDQNTRNHGNMVKKDTCHRFLQLLKTDWNRFLALLAEAIITNDFMPIRRKDCEGKEKPFLLVADDSSYCRNRSKKVELSAKNWDHALRRYYTGFRMLNLAWTEGVSVLPVSFCNMSTCNKRKLLNRSKEIAFTEQGTFGYKIRQLAQKKMTHTLLDLLDVATAAKLQARYLLCDRWFANPATIFSVLAKEYDVICMLKDSSTYYRCDGELKTLRQIFRTSVKDERIQRKLKRKAGKDDSKSRKYLFSATVTMISKKGGDDREVKIVFVRNRNKKSEYLAILSTDIELTENQIVEYYSCRWGIETMFQTCKSFLGLQKGTQSLDYSEIHASTAIAMFQYSMMSYLNCQNSDEIRYGELFYRLLEEVQDEALFNALEMMLPLFVGTISGDFDLPVEALNESMKGPSRVPEHVLHHTESARKQV